MLEKQKKRATEEKHKIQKHFYGLILIMLMCFGIGMERESERKKV
jgi:hypothetical protein